MIRVSVILWGMGFWLVIDDSGAALTNYLGDVTFLHTSHCLTGAEIACIKKSLGRIENPNGWDEIVGMLGAGWQLAEQR